MHRRTFLAGLSATSLLAACDLAEAPNTGRLIVLRHTERTGDMLNAAGIARAAALPAALAGVPIDAIFTPDKQRNVDSATPLARDRGLAIERIQTSGIASTMFGRYPGGSLVWVGNQTNLPGLWEEIGAQGEPPMRYGELFIVEMFGLRAGRVERRRFGA